MLKAIGNILLVLNVDGIVLAVLRRARCANEAVLNPTGIYSRQSVFHLGLLKRVKLLLRNIDGRHADARIQRFEKRILQLRLSCQLHRLLDHLTAFINLQRHHGDGGVRHCVHGLLLPSGANRQMERPLPGALSACRRPDSSVAGSENRDRALSSCFSARPRRQQLCRTRRLLADYLPFRAEFNPNGGEFAEPVSSEHRPAHSSISWRPLRHSHA